MIIIIISIIIISIISISIIISIIYGRRLRLRLHDIY